MDDKRQFLPEAMLDWLRDYAAVGVLVTDKEFRVTFVNNWLETHLPWPRGYFQNRVLFDLVPSLATRGLDRHYRKALSGESRLFSHKFHRYLIPMRPLVGGSDFSVMQQSAKVYPLLHAREPAGTVTVIEDVTERVLRENELNTQIHGRDALLLQERLSLELKEENSTLKEHNSSLVQESEVILEAARLRDRFIQQIISSQEDERKRVARNIHDHLGQELTALRFALSALESDLVAGNDPSEHLAKCKTLATGIDSEVGFLSSELRPTGLDELGLVESLFQFVDRWSAHFNIPAEVHSSGVEHLELPSGIAINVYRIAQEALNNISKHSKANLANLLIENQDGTLTMIVEDNGVGFETDRPANHSENGYHGMGLAGMRERAALIQSSLEVESVPGRGTTIYLRVPTGDQSNN